MDHDVREVKTMQTIIVAFVTMVFSLIPIFGPGLVAYIGGSMNERMKFLSTTHLISSIILGELIMSTILLALGQCLFICLGLFVINLIVSLLLFFLGLRAGKKVTLKIKEEIKSMNFFDLSKN